MADIAVLAVTRETRARLQASLQPFGAAAFVATGVELYDLVRGSRMSAVLTELRDARGESIAPVVRRIREEFPLAPVIGYCTLAQPAAADILAVAQAGANGLLLRGFDDVGIALRAALAAAEDHCLAKRAIAELAPLVAPAARAIIEFCLTHAREDVSVEEMARALGVHRKTLVARLGQAGLPGPRALLHWSRLLLAARLMEDVGRPVEQIAHALDFPSAASLRNMLRRYTGLQPREVRDRGGFSIVLASMRRALAPTTEREPSRIA